MGFKEIFHFFAVAHFLFGFWYHWDYLEYFKRYFGEEDSFVLNWRFKFLTYWNAWFEGLFFAVCLINDFTGTNETDPKKIPFIRKVGDRLFACVVFPISLFVASTFWGFYFLDSTLLLPELMAEYYPSPLYHIMHTNIVIFVLIELCISFRRYPSKKEGITAMYAVMGTYLVLLHLIKYYTGTWPYPFLEVLSFPMRIVFFIGMAIYLAVLYIVGDRINAVVWSNVLEKQKKKY